MEKTNGTSKGQEHYIKSARQPIQVMQQLMTAEQFKGFLIGNIIKYSMRKGYKDSADSDLNKLNQYAYWLELAESGIMIEPVKHSVPADYIFKGLF